MAAVNDALRERMHVEAGQEAEPSAAIIDSQSVKTTESPESRGYDGGKKVNGRKRHVVVDTLGLVLVHRTDFQDRDGECDVMQRLSEMVTRLSNIWAEGSYAGFLVAWVSVVFKWTIEMVQRSDDITCIGRTTKRWIVERTLV